MSNYTKEQLEQLKRFEAALKEDSPYCVNRIPSCKSRLCFKFDENGTVRICRMLKLPWTPHEVVWTGKEYIS